MEGWHDSDFYVISDTHTFVELRGGRYPFDFIGFHAGLTQKMSVPETRGVVIARHDYPAMPQVRETGKSLVGAGVDVLLEKKTVWEDRQADEGIPLVTVEDKSSQRKLSSIVCTREERLPVGSVRRAKDSDIGHADSII